MRDYLLDLLNEAIAGEVSTSIRCMWQYAMLKNMASQDITDSLRDNALDSVKRAMKIGERLISLGGDPSTEAKPINVGSSFREMIEIDLKSVGGVIKIYRSIIETANKLEDETTRSICEEILAEEEEQKRWLMCARGRAIRKI